MAAMSERMAAEPRSSSVDVAARAAVARMTRLEFAMTATGRRGPGRWGMARTATLTGWRRRRAARRRGAVSRAIPPRRDGAHGCAIGDGARRAVAGPRPGRRSGRLHPGRGSPAGVPGRAPGLRPTRRRRPAPWDRLRRACAAANSTASVQPLPCSTRPAIQAQRASGSVTTSLADRGLQAVGIAEGADRKGGGEPGEEAEKVRCFAHPTSPEKIVIPRLVRGIMISALLEDARRRGQPPSFVFMDGPDKPAMTSSILKGQCSWSSGHGRDRRRLPDRRPRRPRGPWRPGARACAR